MAIGESQAFGGVVKGTVALAKSKAGADFKAQLQFADVDLEQCLGEIFGVRRIEGKGNLSMAIDSSGASVYDLTQAVNGTASLISRKGSLTGINVEQILRRMQRSPLSRGGGEFRSGKTAFDSLSVKLKIVDGTANVEDIRIDSQAVRVVLGGSASIPARDLDLRGTASLVPGTISGGSAPVPTFELPFMVQGAWDDPFTFLDAQSLIERSGAAQPLLDALRKHAPPNVVRDLERLVPGATRPATGTPADSSTPDTAGKSATQYAPAATESAAVPEPKDSQTGPTPR
jgi:AsmA protein